MISWEDFRKVELCAGTIADARPFTEAREPAYKLIIDFGERGTRKCSAQITDLYSPGDLVGKQVIAVVNLAPKQIGHFMSECLLTGFAHEGGAVVLAVPDREVENGSILF